MLDFGPEDAARINAGVNQRILALISDPFDRNRRAIVAGLCEAVPGGAVRSLGASGHRPRPQERV